jgi:hypothetical protein
MARSACSNVTPPFDPQIADLEKLFSDVAAKARSLRESRTSSPNRTGEMAEGRLAMPDWFMAMLFTSVSHMHEAKPIRAGRRQRNHIDISGEKIVLDCVYTDFTMLQGAIERHLYRLLFHLITNVLKSDAWYLDIKIEGPLK